MNNYLSNVTFITIVAVILLSGVGIWFLVRGKKRKPSQMDVMEGREFEFFCADLLRNSGFQEVEVTKASGDFGIDILAEKDGITYAIQCKRYAAPVGVRAVQEAYAGRDYYDCMVGAVLTNQYFTTQAVEAAGKLKILLWDRGYLETLIEENK